MRHLVTFCAIFAVVFVPSILLTYLQTHSMMADVFNVFTQVIAHPGKTPDVKTLIDYQPNDALLGLQWLLGFLGFPLAYGAVVVGVSRAYLGQPVRLADAYREALSRWLPILILIVLWFVAIVVVLIAYVGILAVTSAALGAIAGAFRNGPLLTAVMATFLIGVFVFSMILFILLYLVSVVSFIGVVLENLDPVTALGRAFGRVFAGGALWRSTGLALSLTATYVGAFLVLGGGSALAAALINAPALYFIGSGLVELFFVPFAVVVAAVYYYDLRVRREGYDLEMLLERFAGSQPRRPA